MRFLFFILILSTSSFAQTISEVVSDNEDIFFDEFGNTPDWIEVSNFTQDTLRLDGFGLSDAPEAPFKWRFPRGSEILPMSALLILANGDDESFIINTNFELNSLGETVYLSSPSGQIKDSLVIPRLAEDQGYGRLPDSSGTFYFRVVSPGQINDPLSIDLVSFIQLETTSLEYRSGDTIRLRGTENCEEVFFSLDGSPPSKSLANQEYLVLPPIEEVGPYFSLIPTRREYKLPRDVPRFPFLRVRCEDLSLFKYSEDKVGLPGIQDLLHRHEVPIVLLEVDEQDFFSSEEGIYVEGEDTNYEKNGKAWKKTAEWTIIEGEEISRGSSTLEIHGHATRALPQKSLKLTRIRQLPDSTIGWPALYPSDGVPFTEMVLRSMHSEFVGNEFTDYGFRDDLIMSMIYDEMDVYPQKARVVAVYLNGEYWGMHSLRESSEHDHVARETGLNIEDVIIEKGPDHILSLYERIESLDPSSPSSYSQLTNLFDLPNLVDYVLAETWFNNLDWPFNNIKTWRMRGTEGPYRFILFDMDACLKYPRLSPFTRFVQPNISSRNDPDHFLFFEKLLSFPEFRSDLQDRYNELTASVFSVEDMLNKLSLLSDVLSEEVGMHIDRWHYPRDYETWDESREDIKHFLLTRRLYFDDAILSLNPGKIYPNPASHEVFVNDLPSNLSSYRWTTTLGHNLTSWRKFEGPSITVPDAAKRGQGTILMLECKGDLVYRSYPVLIQN